VTKADIEGAYGGDSDEDKELTSAYMLLYRRFDPELNLLPYYLKDMPPHLQVKYVFHVHIVKHFN